jgi:RNA polymerase primary sigma factor
MLPPPRNLRYSYTPLRGFWGAGQTDNASERLKQLIQTGKARGYVLYDELDELLAQAGDAHLDIVLTELAANGIEILEAPGTNYDAGLQKLNEELDSSSPIKMYLSQVVMMLRQTREEEIELVKRISHGGEDAEDATRQLIEANLYLVVAAASRNDGARDGLLELIQEGNIGLMKAAEQYKHTSEYRFATFAIWWIRRSIVDAKLEH